jgi:L-aspartate oxidase
VVDHGEGSTRWAQGGIAAVVDPDDDVRDHADDTLRAGAGLCDPDAVAALVAGGPAAIATLLRRGARWDRQPDGRLALGLEGGHHRRRVVHAGGDATGLEVHRVLEAALEASGVTRRRGRLDLLTRGTGPDGPQVTGAVIRTADGPVRISARAVVLATGGIGHAYLRSTNPEGVDGTGLAAALAAGATLTDMEFVQFHPTALHTGADRGRLPLVSEALRGEGAVLRDHEGRRFMIGRHPLADLAPRDVVARENARAAADAGAAHVWLDARTLGTDLARFPTFLAGCDSIGLDPAADLVPVTPAEHYLCGGVQVDPWGATDVCGLYAVGEVAATGVHGANRLASNSLLEGLVFGARVADRLSVDLPGAAVTGFEEPGAVGAAGEGSPVARDVLTEHAGVLRDAAGLAKAAELLDRHRSTDPTWLTAAAVVVAAGLRTESRGAHHRLDHPRTDPRWQRRVTVRLDDEGRPTAALGPGLVVAA